MLCTINIYNLVNYASIKLKKIEKNLKVKNKKKDRVKRYILYGFIFFLEFVIVKILLLIEILNYFGFRQRAIDTTGINSRYWLV
jgi:hypothetical protein